ncbi:hypothetical protein [Brucella anthropi]|uniref:hypothetical protein n=2 Tax=Brucella anthropi TaxID=529 RepID=UPI003EDEA5B4
MRGIYAVGVALALTGCAGVNYAMTHYSGVPVKSFTASTGSDYRIYDKPTENRLMITPSIAASMGGGAIKGATFGAYNPSNSEVVYRDAAEEYLKSTGRSCSVRDITLVLEPQYEARYECK